jgi:hypothetical protein
MPAAATASPTMATMNDARMTILRRMTKQATQLSARHINSLAKSG